MASTGVEPMPALSSTRGPSPCVSVKACHSMSGGLNGGTLASALNMLDSGEAQRIDDPFLLNPPGSAPLRTAEHADPVAPQFDADFDAWIGPFVMGPVNTRVVRRSAALLAAGGDPAYGADFRYQEYQHFGVGPLAAVGEGGSGRRAAVQAFTLFALRALGVVDARARGLVVQTSLPAEVDAA